MEATALDPEYLHNLSKRYPKILDHIEEMSPDLYPEGNAYCCLSGRDPQEGIFGCGPTPLDALEDWEKSYLKARQDGEI